MTTGDDKVISKKFASVTKNHIGFIGFEVLSIRVFEDLTAYINGQSLLQTEREGV